MGKSRNRPGKSARVARLDPLSRPVKPPKDPALAALRDQKILPIVNKLRDAKPSTRTEAAGAISNIIENEQCRKLLLREQVVYIVLLQTLADDALESRAAGWLILRTLVQEEDADFCVHLYREDVLTAMETASKMVTGTLSSKSQPFDKTTKLQKHFTWSIATSLVTLLEALATARDEILDAVITRPALIKTLFTIICFPESPGELCTDAIHCLKEISDGSKIVVDMILEDQVYTRLKELASTMGSPRSVCATGVLHNVCSTCGWNDQNLGENGVSDAKLLESVTKVVKDTNVNTAFSDKSDWKWDNGLTVLETALQIIGSIAETYKESLDAEPEPKQENQTSNSHTKAIGGGGGGGDVNMNDDDEEEWHGFDDDADKMMIDAHGSEPALPNGNGPEFVDSGDSEGGSGDEGEESDFNMERDMDLVTGATDREAAIPITDLPTLQGLMKVTPHLVRLGMSHHKGEKLLPEKGYSLRMLALSVLNNIAWTFASFDFTEEQNMEIAKGWQPIAIIVWKKVVSMVLNSGTEDVELASLTTSIAWAVARALYPQVPLETNEHIRFISLYNALSRIEQDRKEDENSDPLQSPGVKCIGVLGELAKDPNALEINREIFEFFLTISTSQNTACAELVEALNQIMDVYNDENKACEEVFWSAGEVVIDRLNGAHAVVRRAAKAVDGRKQRELRERADETALNLFRFIKYKEKHRRKTE